MAFVCAIPLLRANSDQDQWSHEDTSGWAWIGYLSHSVQNGNLLTRSEHQCGILNETGKKIGVRFEYKHYVSRNGTFWDDDTFEDDLTVPKDVYFTTSDVPADYVRSTSNPTAEGNFNLNAYTSVNYKGNQQAKAELNHPW